MKKSKVTYQTETKRGIDQYELPDRLKYLRLKRKLSQNELAKKSNLSQATIAQIENGKKDPSLTTLKALARALDIHIAVLFISNDVHVFDMSRMRRKYKTVDDLNETIYRSLGEIIRFAKMIGFL